MKPKVKASWNFNPISVPEMLVAGGILLIFVGSLTALAYIGGLGVVFFGIALLLIGIVLYLYENSNRRFH